MRWLLMTSLGKKLLYLNIPGVLNSRAFWSRLSLWTFVVFVYLRKWESDELIPVYEMIGLAIILFEFLSLNDF